MQSQMLLTFRALFSATIVAITAVSTLCALTFSAHAQESEYAQTIAPRVAQIEYGFYAARTESDRENGFGNLLLRFGVDHRTELQIGAPSYIRTRGGARARGLSDAFVGFKRTLFGSQNARALPGEPEPDDAAASAGDDKLPRPALALLVGSGVPLGRGTFNANHFEPQALLSFEASLSQRVWTISNLGYTLVAGDESRCGQFFDSALLGYDSNDKLSIYGEVFGVNRTAPGEKGEAFFNSGAYYQLSEKFALEGSFAVGLQGSARRNNQLYFGALQTFE